MPVNKKYIEPFIENGFMHICCKAVGNNLLFRSNRNRLYFLKKYAEYSNGYLETYSYILLDNHAHFLVKSFSEKMLKHSLDSIPPNKRKSHQNKYLKNEISFEQAIEFQCKDFFIAYAMAYNKQHNRSGSLFITPFRRVAVNDSSHFTQLIIYHHANIVKHGISKYFENYPWSSYLSILSQKPTILEREEVLDWFGGRQNFITTHRVQTDFYYNNPHSLD